MLSSMNESELRAQEIASRNSGVLTRRQASAVGMTHGQIWRRVKSGRWASLSPGVYVVGIGDQHDVQLRAAVAALPAVVSHEAAAERHGFVGVPYGRNVVTVPHRRTNRFGVVTVHESTDLQPHHVTEIDRLPITTPARTVVDLAAVLRPARLKRLIERAVVANRVRLVDIVDVFDEVARRGKPGTRTMRAALDDLGAGPGGVESELELRLVSLIEAAGLPTPVRQFRLAFRDESRGRIDLAYPDQRLLIEADGKQWHALQRDFISDRRRDNLAQLAGWRVLRFTWDDVTDDPALVIGVINQALTRAPSAV